MLEGRLAVFAALARHLEAAERRGRVDDVVAVDPDGPGLDLLGVEVGLVDVLGPDGGGQAVEGPVGAVDDFIEAFGTAGR